MIMFSFETIKKTLAIIFLEKKSSFKYAYNEPKGAGSLF